MKGREGGGPGMSGGPMEHGRRRTGEQNQTRRRIDQEPALQVPGEIQFAGNLKAGLGQHAAQRCHGLIEGLRDGIGGGCGLVSHIHREQVQVRVHSRLQSEPRPGYPLGRERKRCGCPVWENFRPVLYAFSLRRTARRHPCGSRTSPCDKSGYAGSNPEMPRLWSGSNRTCGGLAESVLSPAPPG